jgi:hypothetical protein
LWLCQQLAVQQQQQPIMYKQRAVLIQVQQQVLSLLQLPQTLRLQWQLRWRLLLKQAAAARQLVECCWQQVLLQTLQQVPTQAAYPQMLSLRQQLRLLQLLTLRTPQLQQQQAQHYLPSQKTPH